MFGPGVVSANQPISPGRTARSLQARPAGAVNETSLKPSRLKSALRLLLAILFVLAGLLHFVRPSMYLAIMPSLLPFPLALVYVSGFFEVLGGIGILVPCSRRWAGYGLIALLIAVFPANIKMFADNFEGGHISIRTVILFLRLPLQFGLIALVSWLAKPDDFVANQS